MKRAFISFLAIVPLCIFIIGCNDSGKEEPTAPSPPGEGGTVLPPTVSEDQTSGTGSSAPPEVKLPADESPTETPSGGPTGPISIPGVPALPVAPAPIVSADELIQPQPTVPTPSIPGLPVPEPSPSQPVPAVAVDSDGDGLTDDKDNCPQVSNKAQLDRDGNQVGDICDPMVVWASPGVEANESNDGSFGKPYHSLKVAIAAAKQPEKAKKVFLLNRVMKENGIVLSDGMALYGGFVKTATDVVWSAPSGSTCAKETESCLEGGGDGAPAITVLGAGNRIDGVHVEAVPGASKTSTAISVLGGAAIVQSVLIAKDTPEGMDGIVKGLEIKSAMEGAEILLQKSQIYAGSSSGKNARVYGIFGSVANVAGEWFSLAAQGNALIDARGGLSGDGETYGAYFSVPPGSPNSAKTNVVLKDNTISSWPGTVKSVGVAVGGDGEFGYALLEKNKIYPSSAISSAGVEFHRVQTMAILATNGIRNINAAGNAESVVGVAGVKSKVVQITHNTLIVKGEHGVIQAVLLDGNTVADLRNNIIGGYKPLTGDGSTTNIVLVNMNKETHKLTLWHNLTSPDVPFCRHAALGEAKSDSDIVGWGWSALNNLIGKDPKFDGQGDLFHIGADSLALNAGYNVSGATNPSFKRDLYGTTRPQGTGYDIGAYEMVVSQ